MQSELSGRNTCLSHGPSQSNLMCRFYSFSSVGQVNKKVPENDNKIPVSPAQICAGPSCVAGLGDTIMGQDKVFMTTRSWQTRYTEEIKLRQIEANSGESSGLLQEIIGWITGPSTTLPFILMKHWDDLYESNCWWFSRSSMSELVNLMHHGRWRWRDDP